ncbi:MAG: cation:proton antiporter [Lachnospiraceae bacterium]|nr:cation:proton antiporter [Lachnospiraceae bacterium]
MISNSVTETAFPIILSILAVFLFFCLIRAIRGPKIADRLMSVNMMGTIVMVMICCLALYLNEGYLVDVALVYAMISFLAVVLISKLYMGIYAEKKNEQEMQQEDLFMEDYLERSEFVNPDDYIGPYGNDPGEK